jgi:hypothetical protein
VARERKRGVHSKRRERRPLPGMLLHIDGQMLLQLREEWFSDALFPLCRNLSSKFALGLLILL